MAEWKKFLKEEKRKKSTKGNFNSQHTLEKILQKEVTNVQGKFFIRELDVRKKLLLLKLLMKTKHLQWRNVYEKSLQEKMP